MPTPTRPIPKLTPEQLERFRAKIDLNGPTQPHMDSPCHVWTGFKNPKGYGMFGAQGWTCLAHRSAFFEAGGVLSKEKPQVLHICDNPGCVRFDHLFAGGHEDNMSDKTLKGRGNHATGARHGWQTKPESRLWGDKNGARKKPESRPRGERNGRAKLTDLQVAYILSSPLNGQELAVKFGVSRTQINSIRRGESRQPLLKN